MDWPHASSQNLLELGAVGQDDFLGAASTPDAADEPFAWHATIGDSQHDIYRASTVTYMN